MEPEDVTGKECLAFFGALRTDGCWVGDATTSELIAASVNAVFGEDAKPVVLTEEERKLLAKYRQREWDNCVIYERVSDNLSASGREGWSRSKAAEEMLTRILSATEPEGRGE